MPQGKRNNALRCVLLRVTANSTNTLSAEQQCFYGEFTSPVKTKRNLVFT